MILTEENRRTRRKKPVPVPHFPPQIPGGNPGLRNERSATICLSHGTALYPYFTSFSTLRLTCICKLHFVWGIVCGKVSIFAGLLQSGHLFSVAWPAIFRLDYKRHNRVGEVAALSRRSADTDWISRKATYGLSWADICQCIRPPATIPYPMKNLSLHSHVHNTSGIHSAFSLAQRLLYSGSIRWWLCNAASVCASLDF
jgi:hypothetical protein